MALAHGMLTILPDSTVAPVGLEQNEETPQPTWHYDKLNKISENSLVFVIDPMLTTEGSMASACKELQKRTKLTP